MRQLRAMSAWVKVKPVRQWIRVMIMPRTVVLAGLLALAAPAQAPACAFHTGLPAQPLSAHLSEGLEVVAVRPALDAPFRFQVVEILRGDPSGTAPPHLVDSNTRRALARNPEHAVLFARGPEGEWRRLLYLDEERRSIADRILANLDGWAAAGGIAAKRDFFAAFLNDPDRRIRELGLRELDAIPYGILREGVYPADAAALIADIGDFQSIAFAPVRILLLGMDRSALARNAIESRVESMAVASGGYNLGPWLVALVENSGQEGLRLLEQAFFNNGTSPSAEQSAAIVEALAIHRKEGNPALWEPIDSALSQLAARFPNVAGDIPQAFGQRLDWSQAALVKTLMQQGAYSKTPALFAAAAYLFNAEQSRSE